MIRALIIVAVIVAACFTRVGLAVVTAVALYLLVTGKEG